MYTLVRLPVTEPPEASGALKTIDLSSLTEFYNHNMILSFLIVNGKAGIFDGSQKITVSPMRKDVYEYLRN
jgi:hypothetical protein